MDDHATVTCVACDRPFQASLPFSRARLARSRLMFLAEVCPHCLELRSYLKSDYRFELVETSLSA